MPHPHRYHFPQARRGQEGTEGCWEKRSLFSLCLPGQEDWGWGPLHRVLSGQGDKNLVCREKPAQGYCMGPGSKHVCVKGLGGEGWERAGDWSPLLGCL